jgi:hypothetical protein
VHLRRALLLFAIVLALAAVAASISRPRDEGSPPAVPPRSAPETAPGRAPTVSPTPAPPSSADAQVVFQSWRNQTRRLEAGEPATMLVEVEEPGQVDVPDLGLSDAAEPVTPASFDVYTSEPGRYPVLFFPASGDEEHAAGTLVITPPTQ